MNLVVAPAPVIAQPSLIDGETLNAAVLAIGRDETLDDTKRRAALVAELKAALVAGRNVASSCAGKTSVLVINRVPSRFNRTPKPTGKFRSTTADAPLVSSVRPSR